MGKTSHRGQGRRRGAVLCQRLLQLLDLALLAPVGRCLEAAGPEAPLRRTRRVFPRGVLRSVLPANLASMSRASLVQTTGSVEFSRLLQSLNITSRGDRVHHNLVQMDFNQFSSHHSTTNATETHTIMES